VKCCRRCVRRCGEGEDLVQQAGHGTHSVCGCHAGPARYAKMSPHSSCCCRTTEALSLTTGVHLWLTPSHVQSLDGLKSYNFVLVGLTAYLQRRLQSVLSAAAHHINCLFHHSDSQPSVDAHFQSLLCSSLPSDIQSSSSLPVFCQRFKTLLFRQSFCNIGLRCFCLLVGQQEGHPAYKKT